MRSAIVSTILLAAVIAVSVFLNVYVNAKIDGIIDAADSLPEFTGDTDRIAETVDRIETLWQRYRSVASLCTSNSHIEKIDRDIIDLKAGYKAKQNGGYIAAVDILKNDLASLSEIYRLNLSGLL